METTNEPSSRLLIINQALRRSNHLKDEFISITVHNQKTPLIIIQGYVDLVEKESDNLSQQQQHALDEIKKQSARLIEINSRLLAVTKLHGDVLALKREHVDFAELTREVAESFLIKIQEKKIRLVLNVPEHLHLKVDKEWMREVWENLISNAVKFTPEDGKITITVNEKENGTVLCQICDTGIGIAPDELGNIFAPFYRTQNSLTGNFEGIGLGLYIVKLIIKGHNGNIRVAPQPHGTCIQFVIPKR